MSDTLLSIQRMLDKKSLDIVGSFNPERSDNVFSKVFAAVGKFIPAKLAGTNAIEAFINPLKGVFDGVNCAMQNVIKGLKNTVSTLINGLIDWLSD